MLSLYEQARRDAITDCIRVVRAKLAWLGEGDVRSDVVDCAIGHLEAVEREMVGALLAKDVGPFDLPAPRTVRVMRRGEGVPHALCFAELQLLGPTRVALRCVGRECLFDLATGHWVGGDEARPVMWIVDADLAVLRELAAALPKEDA